MEFENEVCELYGERMHKKSKKKFRGFVKGVACGMGYKYRIERNLIAKNIVIGNPEKADYIITAHYDTPPRLPKFFVKHMLLYSLIALPAIMLGLNYLLPNILLALSAPTKVFNILSFALPIANLGICGGLLGYVLGLFGNANKKNYNDNSSGVITILNMMEKYKDEPAKIKDRFCFVLTDNEEKGLFGGFSFAKRHKKELKNKTFVNLDCIGKGDQFNLYYFGKNEPNIVKELKVKENGKYSFKPVRSGLMSMSDHLAFKKHDHVCLLSVDKKNNKSLYSQIHSANDTSLNRENIDFVIKTLDDALISGESARAKEKIKNKKILQFFPSNFGLKEEKEATM